MESLWRTSDADGALTLTTEGDLVRFRAVTPKGQGTQVIKEMLMAMKATPWDHYGTISHDQDLLTSREVRRDRDKNFRCPEMVEFLRN